MKIPKTFRVMGTEWRVSIVPERSWTDGEDCLGITDFTKFEIRLRRGKRDSLEHVYLHEITHVVLAAMGHKLQTNEAFVDALSGLMHQVLTTGK